MSKKIALSLTSAAAVAAMTSGCGQSPQYGYGDDGYYASSNTAICTDRSGNRIADRYCQQRYTGGTSPFLWYYLGRSTAIPYYGQPVFGGSYARTAGATYHYAPMASAVTRSVAVSRGGLGSSSRSFSGGRSFGGGRGFGGFGG